MSYKAVLSPDIIGLKDEIIGHRRNLHTMPEAGLLEFMTSSYIKSFLTNHKIEWKSCAKTGVIASIRATSLSTDKWIAFRADMDALSITEETNLEFQSKNQGFMHACGHDGHMAVILTLAKFIKENQDNISHNCLFIFQPAEEGPGGAQIIIEEGALDEYDIQAIYGMHLYPEVAEGHIAFKKGPMMAMTGEFDIRIIGKGGHGAMPHKSLDSVVIACELVGKLQQIVSRSVSPIEPAVVTVGRLEAGERRNVIAKDAILEGTVRAFDKKTFEIIKKKLVSYAKGLEYTHDCQVIFEFRTMYPAVVNDEKLCDDFWDKNSKSFDLEDMEPQMTAEDFASYQEKYPGLFIFLGVRNEKKDMIFPLHNSKFDFDETVLLNGVQAFYNLVKIK